MMRDLFVGIKHFMVFIWFGFSPSGAYKLSRGMIRVEKMLKRRIKKIERMQCRNDSEFWDELNKARILHTSIYAKKPN